MTTSISVEQLTRVAAWRKEASRPLQAVAGLVEPRRRRPGNDPRLEPVGAARGRRAVERRRAPRRAEPRAGRAKPRVAAAALVRGSRGLPARVNPRGPERGSRLLVGRGRVPVVAPEPARKGLDRRGRRRAAVPPADRPEAGRSADAAVKTEPRAAPPSSMHTLPGTSRTVFAPELPFRTSVSTRPGRPGPRATSCSRRTAARLHRLPSASARV
jgi:hypothetical protein